MLQIRPIRTTDFRSIVKLTDEERWDFGTRDLKRMMALQPKGCLVAIMSGQRVGLTTTIAYGRSVGWIGNVVVDRNHRGAGIGSSLVESAINYLRRMRVKAIELNSYPENEAMYRRLGFNTMGGFLRVSVSHSNANPTGGIGKAPFHQILRLDNRAFEADRSRLLRRLHREFPKSWTWISNDAGVSGYSLVKQYKDSSEIGPLICEPMNRGCVGALLRSSIALTKKWPLEMSVPESNPTVRETAMHLGFRVERKGVVMSYAKLKPVAIGRAIGAFGFLDKG